MTCSCQRKDRDRRTLVSLGSPRPSRRAGSVSRVTEDHSRRRRRYRRELLRSASLDQYEHLAHFEMINFSRMTEGETDSNGTDSLEDNRVDRRIILNHSHSKHRHVNSERRR